MRPMAACAKERDEGDRAEQGARAREADRDRDDALAASHAGREPRQVVSVARGGGGSPPPR